MRLFKGKHCFLPFFLIKNVYCVRIANHISCITQSCHNNQPQQPACLPEVAFNEYLIPGNYRIITFNSFSTHLWSNSITFSNF